MIKQTYQSKNRIKTTEQQASPSVRAYCLMSHHFQEQELQRLGWPETDLRARPKGHGGKVQVARRLRQETTMSLKWIAGRLHMGSWTYVSNLLNEKRLPQTNQGMLFLCQ